MSRLILTTEDLWIELRRALAACMKRQELMYEHYDVVLEIDMELLAQWDRIAECVAEKVKSKDLDGAKKEVNCSSRFFKTHGVSMTDNGCTHGSENAYKKANTSQKWYCGQDTSE